MKLRLDRPDGQNFFTAYGDGYVSVNAVRHSQNLLVLADRLVPGWTASTLDSLSVGDFELLAALDVDVVILGTGNALRFPPLELQRPLIEKQKGLEVMDLRAACRTYNVLVNEGRKVAAALIFS